MPARRQDAPRDAARSDAKPAQEPVWLVRFVLVLFLVGFAIFLAHEVSLFMRGP